MGDNDMTRFRMFIATGASMCAAMTALAQPVFTYPELIARDSFNSSVDATGFYLWAEVNAYQTTSASDPSTYETAAQEAVDDLVDSIDDGLAQTPATMDAGAITVHLRGVGEASSYPSFSNATDLFFNSSDAFTTNLSTAYSNAYATVDSTRQSTFASDVANITPWMQGGDTETRRWVEAFAEKYKDEVDLDSDLTPVRFLYDAEVYSDFPQFFESTSAIDTEPRASDVVGYSLYGYWTALQADSAYSTQRLLGFPNDETLEDLYDDFKTAYDLEFPSATVYAPDPNATQDQNIYFQQWWRALVREIVDRAIDDVVFTEIRGQFPNVDQGNYWTSMRIDAAHEVDWNFSEHCPGNSSDNAYYWSSGTTNLQNPVLYAYASQCDGNATDYLASFMQQTRDRIEACTDSFSYNNGDLGADVIPYVGPVGTTVKVNAPLMPEDATRQQFALFRAKDIPAFVVYHWSAYTDSDQVNEPLSDLNDAYADTLKIVDQVWEVNYNSLTLNAGLASGNLADLELADGDAYEIEPAVVVMPLSVTHPDFEVKFDTGFDSASVDTMRIHFELDATTSHAVALKFELRDFANAEWDLVHTEEITASGTVKDYVDVDVTGTNRYIALGSNGRVRMRVTATSAYATYTIDIDLIQIVDATPL